MREHLIRSPALDQSPQPNLISGPQRTRNHADPERGPAHNLDDLSLSRRRHLSQHQHPTFPAQYAHGQQHQVNRLDSVFPKCVRRPLTISLILRLRPITPQPGTVQIPHATLSAHIRSHPSPPLPPLPLTPPVPRIHRRPRASRTPRPSLPPLLLPTSAPLPHHAYAHRHDTATA